MVHREVILGRIAVALVACALAGCAAGGAARGGRGVPTPAPVVEVRYEGRLELEGHYRRPGEKRPYRSVQRFLADGRGGVRLDWTTWAEGDSAGEPETFLVHGDSVWHRDAPDAPWLGLAGERARLARLQTLAGLPWAFAADSAGMTSRPVLATTVEGAPTRTLSGGRGGGFRTLTFSGPRPVALEERRAHPRLGDVTDSVTWRYDDDTRVPIALGMALAERDHAWRLEARRVVSASLIGVDSLLARPLGAAPARTTPDTALAPPEFVELGQGLWALDMEDLDTRTLVVEFADHLAVIEAAVGSANGERIVDAVAGRWPSKPIRHALFSHHHPHYAGGLRALVAAGATIHATPGNASFVRALAERPFTIAPDRLARAPRPLRLEVFDRRLELADTANALIAVDIGARSDHTDEFTVFWFPRQRLVFQTEQGWVTVGGELRASRRAETFLDLLDVEKLAAERLVQSWPMRGNRRELSRAELEALVEKRRQGTN